MEKHRLITARKGFEKSPKTARVDRKFLPRKYLSLHIGKNIFARIETMFLAVFGPASSTSSGKRHSGRTAPRIARFQMKDQLRARERRRGAQYFLSRIARSRRQRPPPGSPIRRNAFPRRIYFQRHAFPATPIFLMSRPVFKIPHHANSPCPHKILSPLSQYSKGKIKIIILHGLFRIFDVEALSCAPT